MIKIATAAAAAMMLASVAAADTNTAEQLVALCVEEGKAADDCQCVADEMEDRLTAGEMEFLLRIGQAETRDQQTTMVIAAESGMTIEGMAALAQKMMDAEPAVREICGSSIFD